MGYICLLCLFICALPNAVLCNDKHSTNAQPYCVNQICYSSTECCPNTYCLMAEKLSDDGGKCISMHEQRVGQLCSLGSRSEMHRPQQRECVNGLMCHLIDDKVWPSGICLHSGAQLKENIMLGTMGDACLTTTDCSFDSHLCCRSIMHGRSHESQCGDYENFITDCEFV